MVWVNVIVQGILLGGLYALFAAGLSLIFGVMRLINIAHGDFIVVAAYMAFFATKLLGLGPFSALLVVLPLCALLGYVLQRGVLNFTLGQELPPLLVTFGLSIILQNCLLLFFSADSIRLQAGPLEVSSVELHQGLSIGLLPLIQFATAILVIGGLQLLFYRTAIGRAYRATSDDPVVAQLMGLETRHIFGLAAGLSFGVSAIAGVFISIRTSIDPLSGPLLLIFGFEAIIIGGLGSLWGTLAGGIVLGVSQAIGGQIDVAWSVLAGHMTFLALLLLRPRGLFAKVA